MKSKLITSLRGAERAYSAEVRLRRTKAGRSNLNFRGIASLTLAMTLLATSVPFVSAANYDQAKAIAYLKASSQDDWAILALATANSLGGVDLNFLKNDPGSRPTDIEKRILAIVAAGQNPETFGQVNLVEKLANFFNGTEILTPGDPTLLSDDVFGLLALVAAGKRPDIRNQLSSFIKQNQNLDGGFSHFKQATSNADFTAMASYALIVAGESNNSEVINRAFNFISTTQKGTGYSHFVNTDADPYTTAWVIPVVRAAERTVPQSAIDFLVGFQRADGSFDSSILLTAYAMIALKTVGSGSPSCNVAINANKTNLSVGETAFLEAVGFTSQVSWSIRDSAKATLNNSFAATGKNTAELAGENAGDVNVVATTASCTAQIKLTIIASGATLPTFLVTILGPAGTVFNGQVAFDSVSLIDSLGQTRSFSQPVAIGTVVEAAKAASFSYSIKNTTLGLFVESIAGFGPQGERGWLYAVNGTKPSVSAAQYILGNNDKVIWFYGSPNDSIPETQTSQAVQLRANVVNEPVYQTPSQPPPQPVVSLTANKSQIKLGETILLAWTTQHANQILSSLPNNWAQSQLSGSISLQPAQTTTYSLTVQGPGGTASASVNITVNTNPSIVFEIEQSNLDFGNLKAGEVSTSRTIKLKNLGTTEIQISATLQNADNLYQQGLFINSIGWQNYSTDLSANFAQTLNLNLQVPTNFQSTGQKTGTLIFWASPK